MHAFVSGFIAEAIKCTSSIMFLSRLVRPIERAEARIAPVKQIMAAARVFWKYPVSDESAEVILRTRGSTHEAILTEKYGRAVTR